MAAGAAVEISDLTKAYGPLTVVDRVSLSVKAGEFVTLLGASGSGKTTTLMMIAGLTDPDSGKITIDGKDIVPLPPERRGLGVVFQSYALFPNYNVYENIAFPLRLRRISEQEITQKVGSVLERVGLTQLGQRRISQLSGGQQQRVALARAIVFSPPVLLMDEPLGALDRKLRDQLQIEIKRIQRDLGVTVIYVTHDQEEALALSDRIAIMRDGRIDQLGTPDEVYERPASPFIAGFLGESNFIDVESPQIVGSLAQVRCSADNSIALSGVMDVGAANAPRLVAMVRPEAIELDGTGVNFENKLDGVLEQREFLGGTVRLSIRSNVGRLTVRLPRLGTNTSLAPGQRVALAWRAKDTFLFLKD
jgi:ABC-type Fe3+/spermidine/putrescine transport system ATPase subunit